MKTPFFYKRFLISIALIISTPSLLFAQAPLQASSNSSNLRPALYGRWFIRGDAGIIWPQIHNSAKVTNGSGFIAPLDVDYYSVIAANNHGQLAAATGYQWQRESQFFPAFALGLHYQHIFSKEYAGAIMLYSLPEFTNYSYNFALQADTLSIFSKINFWQYERVQPYAEGGLGFSRNRTNRYLESAYAGVIPRVSPAYANNVETNFAYNLGLGLDFLLTDAISFSVAYNYQSLGAVRTGSGRSQWTSKRLDIGNWSVDNAYISLTFYGDSPTVNDNKRKQNK